MVNKFVDEVLQKLVRSELSEEDRAELELRLFDHFNDVIIDTVKNGLDEDGLRAFNILLSLPDEREMQEGIAQFVAKIPGIDLKIEEALQEEAAALMAGREIIES